MGPWRISSTYTCFYMAFRVGATRICHGTAPQGAEEGEGAATPARRPLKGAMPVFPVFTSPEDAECTNEGPPSAPLIRIRRGWYGVFRVPPRARR